MARHFKQLHQARGGQNAKKFRIEVSAKVKTGGKKSKGYVLQRFNLPAQRLNLSIRQYPEHS